MHGHGIDQTGGGASVAALAANFGFVALYNDSTIGHILRVRSWYAFIASGANAFAFFASGTVGSLAGAGISLFAGEGQHAGAIYSGTNTIAPPFGILLAAPNTSMIQSIDTPFFYVRPGFSLVVKADTVNTLIAASFMWEDLEMSQLSDADLD